MNAQYRKPDLGAFTSSNQKPRIAGDVGLSYRGPQGRTRIIPAWQKEERAHYLAIGLCIGLIVGLLVGWAVWA